MHARSDRQAAWHGDTSIATSRIMLLLLVAMTGVAPISLYMLVPALPVLATTFGRDISIAQMTVSLYMVGIACSQIIMGPLSDRFGRRPVLLAGLGLMVAGECRLHFRGDPAATDRGAFSAGARRRHRHGGEPRHHPRSLQPRPHQRHDQPGDRGDDDRADAEPADRRPAGNRVRLALDLLRHHGGVACDRGGDRADTAGDAARRTEGGGFRGDVGSLFTSRAFVGYLLCQVLASQIIFAFAGGGPYIVVTQMGRSSAEYGAWFATTGFAYLIGNLFCVRFAPHHSLEKLIWFGLALQFAGSLLNLVWGVTGLNQAPSWLFGTQMIVMFANAFVMSNSAAGAISIRPEAAGTASGAMGFLQMGIGSLVSQFGAYLGGHFSTPVPLNIAIVMLSIACASTMIFLVPRRDVVVSEELIEKAEEEKLGML